MKKYFIVSDVHGFYNELREALKGKGFDINNSEHNLIICGDMFDRGQEAVKLLDFLVKMKKKNRIILIRGNHEDLMEDCLMQLAEGVNISHHHWSNGTLDTIAQLTDIDKYMLVAGCYSYNRDIKPKMKKYFNLVKDSLDYYELDNYIFTHGFIPLGSEDTRYKYDPDWRNATKEEWDSARWDCGFDLRRFNETGKKIVVGHWHCSYAWSQVKGTSEFREDAIWDIYEDDKIVCIDRCTAYTHKVNVMVVEK